MCELCVSKQDKKKISQKIHLATDRLVHTFAIFFRITFTQKSRNKKNVLLHPSFDIKLDGGYTREVVKMCIQYLPYIHSDDFFSSIEIKQAKKKFFFVAF